MLLWSLSLPKTGLPRKLIFGYAFDASLPCCAGVVYPLQYPRTLSYSVPPRLPPNHAPASQPVLRGKFSDSLLIQHRGKNDVPTIGGAGRVGPGAGRPEICRTCPGRHRDCFPGRFQHGYRHVGDRPARLWRAGNRGRPTAYHGFRHLWSNQQPPGCSVEFQDSEVEFDTTLLSGNDRGWHVLLLRYQDRDNYHGIEFPRRRAGVRLHHTERRAYRMAGCADFAAIRTGFGQVNHVRVTATGTTLRFYINGQLVTETDQAGPLAGRMGFSVSALSGDSANGPTEVAFDNLVIRGPTADSGPASAENGMTAGAIPALYFRTISAPIPAYG